MDRALPWRRQASVAMVGVLVLAVLGVVAALAATPLGVGTSPDSVTYIQAARNLVIGSGISVPSGDGEPQALTHFPPLYPFLLALGGLVGRDPLLGARLLTAFLFGANILLVGYIIREYTDGAILPSLLGSLLVLSSVSMLDIHTMAWSEPLFIFLTILSLWLLAKYLDTHSYKFLVGSGLAMSLAWLARYVGPPLIITGLIGLIALGGGSLRSRASRALALFLLSCAPMGLWMARNLALVGAPTDRAVVYHGLTPEHVLQAKQTILSWASPLRLAALGHNKRAVALVAVSTCAALLAVYRSRHVRTVLAPLSGHPALVTLPGLLGTYIASYVGFLLVSISFFDLNTPLDLRILSPVFVCIVILGLTWGYRLVSAGFVRPSVQAVVILCSLVLAVAYVDRGTAWLGQTAKVGRGYTSVTWTQSPTMNLLKASYEDKLIYSNAPEAIYIVLGRPSRSIPRKVDPKTGRARKAEYPAELRAMSDRMETQQAILVFFDTVHWRDDLPSAAELRSLLPLTAISRQSDGTIYGILSESGR